MSKSEASHYDKRTKHIEVLEKTAQAQLTSSEGRRKHPCGNNEMQMQDNAMQRTKETKRLPFEKVKKIEN
jgi:hypothetical protein